MYLVFDVGGSSVKYALMSETGEFIEKGKMKTILEVDDALERFIDSLGNVYDEFKKKAKIDGIAMSLPGQIDVDNGVVYGGGALIFLNKIKLGERLSARCDQVRVAMENDGKCAALSEVWLGNAKGCKNACVLIFGTGIGGGIVIDGKIHRGSHFLAGEVSYCFDEITEEQAREMADFEGRYGVDGTIKRFPYMWSMNNSTRALICRVAWAKGLEPNDVTGEKIYEWADAGDKQVIDILDKWYLAIAKYCCAMYVILDPEIILIGGGISAQPAMIEGVKRKVDLLAKTAHVFDKIKVNVCKYRNDSNLYGALYNFEQKYNLR
ncbi:MAG: ROK family protein [Wujia sp.]